MPSTDRRTRRIRRIRPSLPALAAVCVAALLCGGCSSKAAAQHTSAAASKTAAAAPGTSLEQIATAIGCTAEVNVEAEELRQGGCQAGEVVYRMVTFAAESGLHSWLTEARMYGGLYLVGDRWVVTTAKEEALTALRGRLGGSLETGDTHGDAHGGTPGQTPGQTPGGAPGETPGATQGGEHGSEHEGGHDGGQEGGH
ncbi:hypothetical protein BCL76_101101 [Streptomyces sp. CG 926]|uniref:hypothetical protein n=1 Tax=Streptomyces sp. CG 926 TaxID=1882405 RepID=UPI000D6B6740|nr:hypothetical protein [Streptomyces sp. CG 926]PWK74373.1 hypothetical protein BCL76_101101 [Streptomyces sp. CG 926]